MCCGRNWNWKYTFFLSQETETSTFRSVYTHKTKENSLRLTFLSDFSVSSSGFHATWKAVRKRHFTNQTGTQDVSSKNGYIQCKNRTIAQNSGWIESPGFYVDEDIEAARLEKDTPVDCWITLIAPGKKYFALEYWNRLVPTVKKFGN